MAKNLGDLDTVPVVSGTDILLLRKNTADYKVSVSALTAHAHTGVYEPIIATKFSAFNKAFGTIANTISEGNHTHSCLEELINPGFRLLIYYGYPSAINIAANIYLAAQEFSCYDCIVLGAGLEEDTHPDYDNTIDIIIELKKIKPKIKIFGYIDIGVSTNNYSLAMIQSKTDKWIVSGATGIFLDDMGYDYLVPRTRQNSVIDYVHSKGMKVFINAWNPDDVFSSAVNSTYNPAGTSTAATAGDCYLSESFVFNTTAYIANGGWATQVNFKTKEDKVISYVKSLGIVPCSVDIITGTTNEKEIAIISSLAALLMGKKMFGLQKTGFSAVGGITSLLPSISSDVYNSLITDNVNYRVVESSSSTYTRKQSGRKIVFVLYDTHGASAEVSDLTSSNTVYAANLIV